MICKPTVDVSKRKSLFNKESGLTDYKKQLETINYIYKPKDYTLIGKLTTQEYSDVLDCLKNSPNIRNKYRKLL